MLILYVPVCQGRDHLHVRSTISLVFGIPSGHATGKARYRGTACTTRPQSVSPMVSTQLQSALAAQAYPVIIAKTMIRQALSVWRKRSKSRAHRGKLHQVDGIAETQSEDQDRHDEHSAVQSRPGTFDLGTAGARKSVQCYIISTLSKGERATTQACL